MSWVVLQYYDESPEKIYLIKDGFKTIDQAYDTVIDEEIDLYKRNGIDTPSPLVDSLLEDITMVIVNEDRCCVKIDGANYEYYILRNKELTPFAFMCKIKNDINMEKINE
jgi:hypothetical protein